MKLSKQERKLHEEALAKLQEGNLLESEREFVYRHLRPEATTDIGKGSAFFTPWEIAGDFCIETLGGYDDRPTRILDLCAGYGVLSLRKWLSWWGTPKPDVTCVEINPEYVAIGKQLFPEARWICADVFDVPSILEGEKFDEFYSNPPFGRIPAEVWRGRSGRKPARFEYAVAEIGMQMAETGTMIGQQGISDWKFSGCRSFTRIENAEYSKWSEQSGLILANNCGLDCSHTPFNATRIMVDIFNVQRAGEE